MKALSNQLKMFNFLSLLRKSPGWVVIVLLILFPAFAERAYNIDSLLQQYSVNLAEHKHFTASFTQKRYLSLFEKPLVSTGTITFSYPDNIKLHYKTPFESIILFTGGELHRFRKDADTYVEQPAMEIVTKAITREMMRWLRADFLHDFPYKASVKKGNPRDLILIPENAAAKTLFSAIELTFSKESHYIERIALIEQSKDSIVITHKTPSFTENDLADFSIPGIDK